LFFGNDYVVGTADKEFTDNKYIPVIFLIGVFKARIWGYLLFAGYGILNLFGSISVLFIVLSVEVPPGEVVEITIGWSFVIGIITYLSLAILGIYCWKKIHPDYKFKNIFTVKE